MLKKESFLNVMAGIAIVAVILLQGCSGNYLPEQEDPPDTAGLTASINEAKDLLENTESSEDGEDVQIEFKWATQSDIEALEDAVSVAESVKDSATTQTEIDAAKTTLDEAIVTFKAARSNGKLDAAGKEELLTLIEEADEFIEGIWEAGSAADAPLGNKWATPSQLQNFNEAYAEALAVFSDTEATASDVAYAKAGLQAAIDAIEGNSLGTKTNFNVTAADFDKTIKAIRNTPGTYVINLIGDLIDYPGIELQTAGVNITLKGTGTNKVTWKSEDGSPTECEFFYLLDNTTLILEDITIGRGTGNTSEWFILSTRGGTFEIRDGVNISNCDSDTGPFYYGVSIARDGELVMSGGVIEKCLLGIMIREDSPKVTISGGIIRDNYESGILTSGAATNGELYISGGTFSGSILYNGVQMNGKGNTVTITGGIFSGNHDAGFSLSSSSEDCIVNIDGGEFNNNNSGESGNGVSIGGKGNTVTITDGIFSGNYNAGFSSTSSSEDCIINIDGGEFNNNNSSESGNGVGIGGKGNTVTITDGEFNNNHWTGLGTGSNSEDCIIFIDGGEFSNNESGVQIGGKGNTFTITDGIFNGNSGAGLQSTNSSEDCIINIDGGEFSNNESGIQIGGKGNTFTITDGIFNGNSGPSLLSINSSEDCIINIYGGKFNNNYSSETGTGVSIGGKGNTFTITDGEFSNNYWDGLNIGSGSEDCIIDISGGIFSENQSGISIRGNGNQITVSGSAEIKDNSQRGISFTARESCHHNFLTLTGGTISNNGSDGLFVGNPGNGFRKDIGCLIYGNNSPPYSNGVAIWVDAGTESLRRYNNAESEEVYSATVNETMDGIVPGTKLGTWE